MNILITGAGSVMGQSIYKALAIHDYGESVKIHFANSELLGAGRYFSHPSAPIVDAPIFPLAADQEYANFLERYVEKNAIDIVFSGTQHELSKIATFRDRMLKAATIPSAIAAICMDKVETSSALKRYGIRVPETCTLSEYIATELMIQGPIVVKPNHSSSSRSIFRLKGRQEVLKLIADGTVIPDSFLVQELLSGEEYTCGCYIDRYTKQINHITFKRTLTPDGATFYGEIVENPAIGRYITDVGSALIKEGLDFGHINIQLILTESGPVLFEINGRLSSTEASKAHYGFNSCAAFVTNIVKQQPYTGWQTAHTGRFLRFYEEIYFD
jgi:carbamoyl-phosphate synthase large subunit